MCKAIPFCEWCEVGDINNITGHKHMKELGKDAAFKEETRSTYYLPTLASAMFRNTLRRLSVPPSAR